MPGFPRILRRYYTVCLRVITPPGLFPCLVTPFPCPSSPPLRFRLFFFCALSKRTNRVELAIEDSTWETQCLSECIVPNALHPMQQKPRFQRHVFARRPPPNACATRDNVLSQRLACNTPQGPCRCSLRRILHKRYIVRYLTPYDYSVIRITPYCIHRRCSDVGLAELDYCLLLILHPKLLGLGSVWQSVIFLLPFSPSRTRSTGLPHHAE